MYARVLFDVEIRMSVKVEVADARGRLYGVIARAPGLCSSWLFQLRHSNRDVLM